VNDPWILHLKKYNLLGLHNEAQQVGFRIGVANGWTFALEYEGALAKYHQPGLRLKTFKDTEQGRAEARAFLATVKAD
jgi:hypothetical protein